MFAEPASRTWQRGLRRLDELCAGELKATTSLIAGLPAALELPPSVVADAIRQTVQQVAEARRELPSNKKRRLGGQDSSSAPTRRKDKETKLDLHVPHLWRRRPVAKNSIRYIAAAVTYTAQARVDFSQPSA